MLQPTVWSQLARVRSSLNLGGIRGIVEVNFQPPIKVTLNQISNTMERLSPKANHWFIGGERSLAAGLKYLKEHKIIAVPTDTIYGLTTLAQNKICLQNLYELKGRDKAKPVAICVSSTKDIKQWAEVDHLPKDLLISLLPGPFTVVLKRKPTLNPDLNPGIDTIGIRVTNSKFVRSLCKLLNQPLALTSANSSNERSSLTADEFEHLWPELGGIFYSITDKKLLQESYRVGSTVIDLTKPYEFRIIRAGIDIHRAYRICYKNGMKESIIPEVQ